MAKLLASPPPHPPYNTDEDFVARAIDLSLLDVDAVPHFGWKRIGAFSSGRAPILITLGGSLSAS